MQRLVALMVAVTFIGATAQVSSLHTHSYTDHAHPEHHHGPAAHEHPQTAAHHDDDDDDDMAHLKSCDPGQHIVSVTLTCPTLRHVGAFDVPWSNVGLADALVLLRSAHTVTDVRVHGPPLRTQAPPRAPPLTLPA